MEFFWGGKGQCLIRAQAKLAEYPGPELKGNKSLEGKKAANLWKYHCC